MRFLRSGPNIWDPADKGRVVIVFLKADLLNPPHECILDQSRCLLTLNSSYRHWCFVSCSVKFWGSQPMALVMVPVWSHKHTETKEHAKRFYFLQWFIVLKFKECCKWDAPLHSCLQSPFQI